MRTFHNSYYRNWRTNVPNDIYGQDAAQQDNNISSIINVVDKQEREQNVPLHD